MRRMMLARRHQDSGAVVLLVTIVTTFVLLGAGAILLNTGSWYAERAQLQNGADAAALAVADSCVLGSCQGAYASSTDLAPAKANKNANDLTATVDYVCGGTTTDTSQTYGTVQAITTGTLATCSSALPNWTSTGCPNPPATVNASFVNVHTSTKTSAGDSIPVIGALGGNGQHVKTCAQVRWGYPGGGKVVPFTISECEWFRDTSNGSVFAPSPPYATNAGSWPPTYPAPFKYDPKNPQPPVPGGEDVLPLHGTASVLTGGYFDTGGLDGWAPNPAPNKGGPTLSVDSVTFQDGIGSLKVNWSAALAGADQALDSKEAVTIGKPYTLTAWVYAAPDATGTSSVRLGISNSDGTGTLYTQTQVGDGTWHLLRLQDSSGNPVSFTPTKNQANIWLESTTPTVSTQITWLDTVNLTLASDPGCTSQENPPSGFDMPGGFGWMYDQNNDCSVTISPNQTVPDNTGASMDGACQSVLQNYSCDPVNTPSPPCQPQVLLVPIYDGYCGNQSGCTKANPALCGNLPPQSNGCYHIGGYGAFVATGFSLSGSGGLSQKSTINPNHDYCKGSAKCVYGFFTKALVKDPGDLGGPPKGATIIGLSG